MVLYKQQPLIKTVNSLLLPWFVYEATTAAGFFAKFVLIGGLIGGVIGGTVGLTIYRKGQNAVSEVIEQIEELTGEKE